VLARQACDNLTESVLPIRTNQVFNKPIVAGQRALSPFPRRTRTRSIYGSRLSQETWQHSDRTLGTAHPTTLIAAAAYTFALAWLGEGQSARMVGLETAERCRQAFGADHWLTITATAALTFAHVAASEYRQAAEISRDIADQARSAFGPDHWVSMLASAARTFALIGDGEFGAAQALGADTLDRCSRTLGLGHPIAVNLRARLDNLDRPSPAHDPAD